LLISVGWHNANALHLIFVLAIGFAYSRINISIAVRTNASLPSSLTPYVPCSVALSG